MQEVLYAVDLPVGAYRAYCVEGMHARELQVGQAMHERGHALGAPARQPLRLLGNALLHGCN
eukprot:1161297-Pelagomonas_calceolata.AAC.3